MPPGLDSGFFRVPGPHGAVAVAGRSMESPHRGGGEGCGRHLQPTASQEEMRGTWSEGGCGWSEFGGDGLREKGAGTWPASGPNRRR
jgi:hypothetical protein